MANPERVNIGPQAREVKENGINSDTEMFDPALGIRPELYVMTSVLIDHMVSTAYKKRNIKDMTKKVNDVHPFATLREDMQNGLLQTAVEEIGKFKAGSGPEKLQPVFTRFELLRRRRNPNSSDKELIEQGIGSSTIVMANVLDLIPRVMTGDRTHERIWQAAEASLPLIIKFASLKLDSFVYLIEEITDPAGTVPFFRTFDQQYFELASGARERLDFSEKAKDLLEKVTEPDFLYPLHERGLMSKQAFEGYKKAMAENPEPHLGCPALVNFGEGSAIRTLWNWHLEIAREVYPLLYPSEAAQQQVA